MSKLRIFLLLAMTMSLIVAACAPQETPTPTPTEEATPTQEIAASEATEETEETPEADVTEDAEETEETEETPEADVTEDAEEAEETEEAEATPEATDAMGMDMDMSGSTTAAYMTITNNGDEDITLTGAEVDFAESVETHETTVEDDVARMAEIEGGIVIPAGETVELRPGGLHLMLINITEDLIAGETAEITLIFDSGSTVTATFPITDEAPEDQNGGVETDDLVIEGFWIRPAAAGGMDDMEDMPDGDEDTSDMDAEEEDAATDTDADAQAETDDETVVAPLEIDGTATYEGRYTFDYPEQFEAREGTDIVTVTGDNVRLLTSGPDNYNMVLGEMTHDTPEDALAFFLDRSGYAPGDAIESEIGLAALEVSLPRRNLTGTAVLLDLGFDRRGVVIVLSGENLNVDAALTLIAETLTYPADIVDVASTTEGFSILVEAVVAAGLENDLRGGEITVFAPTDEAFAAALEELDLTAEELLEDTETLTSILTYHVVDGVVLAEDVVELDGETLTTLNGAELTVSVTDDGVILNETVNVTDTDITAFNGVIHVIDAVLLPPADETAEPAETTEDDTSAEATPEATEAADESDEDEAQDEQDSTETDESAEAPDSTLFELAANNADLSTLVAAVAVTNLTGALNGEAELTLFAPTNEAFNALLDELDITLADLQADPERLEAILAYHAVEGTVLAETVIGLDGENVATVNGATVAISVVDGNVILNDSATVTDADLLATNGVVHVIDTVLLPPETDSE